MPSGQIYNETELLRRIADGDQSAFSELFRRYFDQLYLVIFKYTQRNADAEDIVQTTFVKAWEKRHLFREIDNPMNWLFIAARNECLDRLRKNRLSRQYRQHLTEVFNESDISPESIFINKEYAGLYQQAIKNLPDKQQQAYLLSREKGLTYDEIAQEMNIGKSTAKEHMARAIKSIRAFVLSQTNQRGEFILFLIFFKLLSAYPFFHSSLL